MQSRPSGLKRLLYRAPIWFYRMHAGWLLGRRFMLLEHIGRRSGQVRRTVLEVPLLDRPNVFYAASGWGTTADWYRNLQADPTVTVTIGARSFTTRAELCSPEESGTLMARYHRQRPRTAATLAKAVGWKVETDTDWEQLGSDSVPWVKLVDQARAPAPLANAGG